MGPWTKRAALILATLTAVILAMAIFGHKSVHAELFIPATPAQVWAVLTDAPGYAEWNPVIVPVEGEHVEGQQLTYEMTNQDGKTNQVKVKVVKLEPERELNQFGGIRGVLTFDHHWYLEPVEGGTKVTQHEDYRGVGLWFWDPSWFETAYGQALEALRDRVASLAEPPA